MSVGIWKGQPVLDLNYEEDSACEVDGNVVKAATGELVDLSFTAEQRLFSAEALDGLLRLADKGLAEIFAKQKECLPERLTFNGE